MKYLGTQPVGEDQDYTSYLFSFRKQELETMFTILENNLRYIPKEDVSVTQFRNRLGNVVSYLKKTLNEI